MLTDIEVAKKLLQINAIRLDPQNPFKWASGLNSPIYCDNRKILSYPVFREQIKQSLVAKSKELGDFDKVAGVATAGIAHGALVADAMELPFIYVRSSTKKHGAKNRIEGVLNSGEKCLVVEDLISTGGSSIEAVEVLRENGADVVGVIAIFTYQFKRAAENFSKANCPFITLSNYSALISAVREDGIMDIEKIESLRQWRLDPETWSHKHSL